MTWGEFKAAVDAAGVKDTDELWYIDIQTLPGSEIQVVGNEDLGIAISD